MEPNPDLIEHLQSIGGIVTLTLMAVQLLKRELAEVPYLNRVPTAAYALAVSAALTWVAHTIELLPGDLSTLLTRAVLYTLIGFGTLTASRWAKPIGDSTAAIDARIERAQRRDGDHAKHRSPRRRHEARKD